MRLDTSQQMRTDMRLRMAPRMIQSMEILQLPLMALQERIDQELSENPVLVDLRDTENPEPEAEEAPASTEREDTANEFPPENYAWTESHRPSLAPLSDGAARKPAATHYMPSST